jgi:SAM-dependent methyltransferase
MMNLLHRHNGQERIDGFLLDTGAVWQTHREIKSINRYTFGYWPTIQAVRDFLVRNECGRREELTVLDIGCGDGETLRRLDDYGRANNFPLKLTGIDHNPSVITAAVTATPFNNIEFIEGDALAHEETYDLMVSSLTTHHLTGEEIVRLIRRMTANSRLGWFICDLHRHPLPYYFIKYFVRLGGFNPMICHDAPLSVARGFRRSEWLEFLTEAGVNLEHVRIFWYPNFRYGIRYEKPSL